MLNFTVGPVMMNSAILNIGANQVPYFRTQDFSKLMMENEKMMLRAIEANESSRVIFLTSSGTGAMEASVKNLFTGQDKVLVVNGGGFGARFKAICDMHGIPADSIILEHGHALSEEDLYPYEGKKYTAFLVNANETSTGVLYDMEMISEFCKRNNLFLLVDAISTFLADPYHMKKWGVNATVISSQKALAIPAGMAFVVVDEKAQERISRIKLKEMYFNFKDYLSNGKRGQTPYTPAVGTLYQLNKRLEMVLEEGVEKQCQKTAEIANLFRQKIKGLPFEISSENCSNALTPLRLKGKMMATELINYLADTYDIYINPCSGEEKETHIRVGHIGEISDEQMNVLIDAFYDMNRKGVL
ncbi:aminotransferase class V-fold PLP-dependent enzyme [[Clostridium] symbiosum]|uniref:pyridoxal-phosphate-dependent aminotransferase family protein n=1 Tax=Clostridium symbiosum TaxID=1512 RepID=UPI001D06F496|nr:aminotransferase class V-fold PLP-dependent enzyme [[Clostridium] symbiosum]MCB6608393.1 aminotransferase class V-fold PLP-dependent enzyme [[Clostridium] symbiosum]MCB6930607.1 aminotransferase class V-fold PLP-dependent enzyme [[Clostridium] symbiosum]